MVQLSPDTHNSGWEAASGYRDKDTTLIGFSHTHLSGTGGVDLGDFLFTPFREPVPFSKDDETASPGYYRVRVQDITVELTALPRTGCQRYTFQGEGERKLWVDLRYNIGDTHPDRISFRQVSDREIEGGRHVSGWAPDRWMFFSAAFSVPFLACEPDGGDRYLLTFPADTKELTIVVGLSPTDAEAACRNRLAEAPACDFDRILEASEALWEAQLGKVVVEGGTPAQRTNFHTALYHTLIAPNLLSDVGERPFYSTLSLWDTYRTWNPLMILLNPEMEGDMAYSLVRTFERDGKLPLWALGGVDVDCMIGYHSVSVMTDAWLRGIRTFDGEKALEAMVRS
jgi:predicted alpha-1,2-mannosidase